MRLAKLHIAFVMRAVVAGLVPGRWLGIPALFDSHVCDVGRDLHVRVGLPYFLGIEIFAIAQIQPISAGEGGGKGEGGGGKGSQGTWSSVAAGSISGKGKGRGKA